LNYILLKILTLIAPLRHEERRNMSEPIAPVQEQPVDPKELNFRKQREHYEYEMSKIAKEKAALEEQLRQIQSKPNSDDDDTDDEPYVDKKRLKKTLNSFEVNIEKKIEQMAEKKALSLMEQERNSLFVQSHPDFSKIMDSDLVQKFADQHPLLAQGILTVTNHFERQKLVYANIKALKMDAPPPPVIQEKVDANRRHPGYQPNGVGSPGNMIVADFSPQGMKEAHERVQAKIRNLRI